jgi:hypothetical protein
VLLRISSANIRRGPNRELNTPQKGPDVNCNHSHRRQR